MIRAAFLIAVLAVFLGITAFVALQSFAGDSPSEGRRGPGAIPVAVHTVQAEEFADIVEALGTARANETVMITARVSDTISRLNFDSGDRVVSGAILAELTDNQEAADLAEARATLREAQQELNRVEDLIDRGIAPRQRLDEANAGLQRARARVNSIEAQLADRIVRAPFDGVIGLREVSVGGLVRPGDPIASLDDTGIIKLDFAVPERFLANLEAGTDIAAQTSTYPDEVFIGTIAQIDSRIDPVTRTVTVRAEIDNQDSRLRPGQLMTVEIRQDIRQSPAIPGAAITRYLDSAYVFVIEEGERGTSVRQQEVELGLRQGQNIEVLSGLTPGDRIVSEGVHRVRDRMPVMISNERAANAGSVALGASPQ